MMVLALLKKTPTSYFAKVHLYCLLRPLNYGVTTLVSSMNLYMDGLCFLYVFVGVWPVERNVLGSGYLVRLCEHEPFPLQDIQV